MAPEHEARLRADLHDHETDEPRRRRRPAADWGVNEDIFDRMPSRFSRVDRRAEHHDVVLREREVASWGDDAWAEQSAPRGEVVWDSERETWRTDAPPAREPRTSAEVSAALDEWRAGADDARGANARATRGVGRGARGRDVW